MSHDPFLGEIRAVAFGYAPPGWATCEGQLLAISHHPALFGLIGAAFGGDGRTTFALPDLRGRTMLGCGLGLGLSPVELGQAGEGPAGAGDPGGEGPGMLPHLGIQFIIAVEGVVPATP